MPIEGRTPDPVAELRVRVEPWVEETLSRSAQLGFLGSMSVHDQIDHALGFVYAYESELGRSPLAVLDLGSGGGVPALILLCCWPESRLVLLDSNDRRTQFLSSEIAGRKGAERVEVVCGRAEEAGRNERLRLQFELVTSRSFGAPAVAAECGGPFLAVGGVMVVSEPPDDYGARRWPSVELAQLGLEPSIRVRFNDSFGYQVLVKSSETSDRYPRRVGIPAKRPLF